MTASKLKQAAPSNVKKQLKLGNVLTQITTPFSRKDPVPQWVEGGGSNQGLNAYAKQGGEAARVASRDS